MTAPIFILAGEESGDILASRVMQAVNAAYGHQNWVGVGGTRMAAQGLHSFDDMARLSLIGIGAALRHYKDLSQFADDLVDLVIKNRPKLILTVDAKGFSVRFASRLKKRMRETGWSAPIIHTVAPTVWAWGGWRRHKFARVMDGLLCLFPFEPDYFTPLHLKSYFIGHPAAFDQKPPKPKKSAQTPPSHPVVLLLPGSRSSEVTHILPIMLAACDVLRQRFLGIKFILPAVPRLQGRITALCDGRAIDIVEGAGSLGAALENCDAVLAASGTVTLEAALNGVPGAACYKAAWPSAMIGRLLVDMRKVILPNAILGREIYPFLFQEQMTPENLASAIEATLHDPAARSNAYQAALDLRSCLTGGAGRFDALVIDALQHWLGPPPKSKG
jgi:lipid-A-disaccharide synthase